MALKFIEGFRWTNDDQQLIGERWSGVHANCSIQPGPIAGTNALRVFNAGNATSRPTLVDTTTQKLVMGFRFRTSATNTNQKIVEIRDGATIRGTLGLVGPPGAKLKWVAGSTITAAGFETALEVSQNQWHYIEIEVTAGIAGNGRVRIFLDGAEADSGGAFTSFAGAATSSDNFALSVISAGDGNHDFTDLYVADDTAGQVTGPIGDVQVVTAVPGSDVATGWDTTTSGSHFEPVNELNVAHPLIGSDTDYIQTSGAPPEEDRFGIVFPDLTLNVGDTIFGVQVGAVMGDVTTGAPDVQIGARSVAADDYSAAKILPDGGYEGFFHMVEEDPNALAAWTKATVEAMELGLKTA